MSETLSQEQTKPQSADADAQGASAVAHGWLERFSAALEAGDIDGLKPLFADESYWRDFVAFTWNIVTLEGFEQIAAMLRERLADVAPHDWAFTEEPTDDGTFVEGWLTFETRVAHGKAHLRLQDGKCLTLLTTMQELRGFEEAKGPRRTKGVEHVITKGNKTWKEKRADRDATLGFDEQPYVVVVGGGQGGIGLAARLQRQGIPTIVLEKNARAGDSWRKRYKSLHLHDPVWYDHMPYLPFPDDWPMFPSKDKLGDWLEHYADIMELNYWTNSKCLSASYDESAGTWRVTVDHDGQEVELRPTQLVIALGVSGYPQIPEFPGADTFAGVQTHSSQFSGEGDYAGKKAVVIGSNNSAFDISAQLWQKDAGVTMVQRSSTHIIRSATLMEYGLGDLYSERALANGITTEKADMLFASWPYRLLPSVQKPIYDTAQEVDADFYKALADAGFDLDFGEDGSGLFVKYLRRGSGYYIDVGASQLVIDGEVKVASGQVVKIEPDAVVLEDGTRLPADIIVYATGYGSMNQWLEDLISPEVADQVGKVWGWGSDTKRDPGPWEGELRNMWKPTNVDQLWIHGGNLHQSRHYSRYLALQLKARMEGLDTPVYQLQPSHHTA